MAFRFQRRIKIAPGVRLNVSKSGVSTSVGTRGARVTFGDGKRRTTVGIPGTGLSHTSVTTERHEAPQRWGIGKTIVTIIVAVTVIVWIFG